MNIKKSILLITGILIISSPAHADSLGGFMGVMDTVDFGTGQLVGAVFRFDAVPLVSLELRGAYATSFDTLRELEKKFELLGFGNTELDKFCIVPLEIGAVTRFSLFGIAGFYVGGGPGYYIVPSFDVKSSYGGFSVSEKISNITGWWAAAGVEAGLPNLSIFAEMKYTYIRDRLKTDFEFGGYEFHIDSRFDMSGISTLIGLRLKW